MEYFIDSINFNKRGTCYLLPCLIFVIHLSHLFPSLFRDDASFTHPNVQRVPGSPTQNGSNYEIMFYVDYPGGGTMSLQILLLIISEQLDSIATNTQLTLRLLTIPTTPTPPQINITDNIRANALSVVLKDFNATEVGFKVKHYNTGKKSSP